MREYVEYAMLQKNKTITTDYTIRFVSGNSIVILDAIMEVGILPSSDSYIITSRNRKQRHMIPKRNVEYIEEKERENIML